MTWRHDPTLETRMATFQYAAVLVNQSVLTGNWSNKGYQSNVLKVRIQNILKASLIKFTTIDYCHKNGGYLVSSAKPQQSSIIKNDYNCRVYG